MLLRRLAPALLAVATAASSAAAQRPDRTADWLARCRGDWNGGDDRARVCDVEETTLPARGGRLRIDGGPNGGITVTGWDRNEIRVVARIEAHARTPEAAEAILKDIAIRTSSDIHADGPSSGRRDSWSVSFDVYVPRRSDLDLETRNGGIDVADVEGSVRFDAVNGGVSLANLAGDVRGSTQNGGLDVRTQNGGVEVAVPASYNAELETGTVNGGIDIDFPITVSGRLGRSFATRLGTGGAPIRIRTTNGGVTLRRR